MNADDFMTIYQAAEKWGIQKVTDQVTKEVTDRLLEQLSDKLSDKNPTLEALMWILSNNYWYNSTDNALTTF